MSEQSEGPDEETRPVPYTPDDETRLSTRRTVEVVPPDDRTILRGTRAGGEPVQRPLLPDGRSATVPLVPGAGSREMYGIRLEGEAPIVERRVMTPPGDRHAARRTTGRAGSERAVGRRRGVAAVVAVVAVTLVVAAVVVVLALVVLPPGS